MSPMEERILAPTPPAPAQHPTVLTKHGDTRIDPYFWLRQRANPEVVAYLEAENEHHELRFRDLTSGRDLEDVLDGVYYGSAWSADSRTFFYVRTDKAMRPHQVWRHMLGTPTSADVLVLQEDDERFELSVELTKS